MLLCIVGPTACYKSQTAITLAQKFSAEILSCDSVAVYRGLDIGSAKPSKEEQIQIRHHLIDIVDPNDSSFSASAFSRLADECIADCILRDKLPILAGGSGLYFDSVLHSMCFGCPSNPILRSELEKEYDADPSGFKAILSLCDPVSASRISLNDRKRLVRAMEVYRISGKPFSSFGSDFYKAQQNFKYDTIRIGLTLPRELLYARIERRVDAMMEEGLLEETDNLLKKGIRPDMPSMQSIGYAQLIKYLNGICTLDEAVEEIKLHTRHLAKRQLTWFKRDKGITWFDCSDYHTAENNIFDFISEKLANG